MKNSKFRIVIVSFLTIIMLFAASCGNSFSSKPSDSDTAAVNLQIPPQIFKSIANREGISEDEIQNQSVNVFVNLFVDKNEPISQDLHDFDVKNGETITFPNIRVGASVWASASIMLENKIYSGSSDRKEVTENGVDLDLTLILEKIYLELGIEDAIEAVKTLQDNANLKITGKVTQAQFSELIDEIVTSIKWYKIDLDISETTGLTELTDLGSPKIQSYSLPPSIQVIESKFFTNSGWIDNIEFPAGNENFIIEDNILYNADKTRIIRCITGKSMAESFTIPASVETIDDRAFYNCWYKKIIIPSTVKSIGDSAFTCSYDLQEFVVDSENPNYTNIDSCLYTKDGEVLIQYPLGRLNETYSIAFGTKKIGANAFGYSKSLKEISIPSSVGFVGENALNIEILEKISFDDSENWVSLQDNSQLTQAQLENPKNYLYTWKGGTGLLVEGLTKREFSATDPLLTTESSEEGVLLNVNNLNISDQVSIYTKLKENSWYMLFNFVAQKESYSLLDKYVNPDTERTYLLRVNGRDYTSTTVSVSHGLGRPEISASNVSDGIELSVNSLVFGNQVSIRRIATDASNQANINIFAEGQSSKHTTLMDYFVQEDKEYEYYITATINDYEGNSGVRYTFYSSIVSITAQSGLGELKITNKPVATVDYSNRRITFATLPQADLSETLDESKYIVGHYFNYVYQSGYSRFTASISCTNESNIYDYNWMSEEERYKGKTLSLVTSPQNSNIYESYVYDKQNKISYIIYQYDNSVDLSGLPQQLEIPAESINQSEETTNGFNASFVTSDEGVKISLINLPIGGNLNIIISERVKGQSYAWDLFRGTITSEELELVDKYVIANETIDYNIIVSDSTGSSSNIFRTVTATGGAGRFALTGTNVDEGVKLSIEKPSTFTGSYTLSHIKKVQFNADDKAISNAFFSFNTDISSSLSLTDSFVNPNEEYYYFAQIGIPSGYEGITYFPHVKRLSAFIVGDGQGYGDLSLLNQPEFTVEFTDNDAYPDEKLFNITYTTEPVFNKFISDAAIQNLSIDSIYLSFNYFDSATNMYPGILYYIKPFGQATERSYTKGSSLSLVNSSGDTSYDISIDRYPYADGEQNGIVSYYVEYRNSDSLDKLPQTIQVPSE